MGRNCIGEVLKAFPNRIIEVYTSQKPRQDPLYTALEKAGIPLIDTPKNRLTKIVDSESHQSYVAAVHPRKIHDVKAFLQKSVQEKTSLVLMLDSIYDPQNFGAILRAAECFGVDLVVYSKNRGTDITPVTTKTSAGASELVPISKVSNLAETMKAFQEAGFWSVGADVSDRSKNLNEFEFSEKTLLLLGSEGKGLQPILVKNCDFLVSIPMLGNIDSLNVSQATAVLLNSYRQFFSTH